MINHQLCLGTLIKPKAPFLQSKSSLQQGRLSLTAFNTVRVLQNQAPLRGVAASSASLATSLRCLRHFSSGKTEMPPGTQLLPLLSKMTHTRNWTPSLQASTQSRFVAYFRSCLLHMRVCVEWVRVMTGAVNRFWLLVIQQYMFWAREAASMCPFLGHANFPLTTGSIQHWLDKLEWKTCTIQVRL